MKKLVLIPTLLTTIVPLVSITSCNNSKHEYLADIQFEKNTVGHHLTVTIDLSDWKHNWVDTDLNFTTQTTEYTFYWILDPAKGYLSITYNKHETIGTFDFDILEPELAITLTDTVSGDTKTHRFTFLVKIVHLKMVDYTFETLE